VNSADAQAREPDSLLAERVGRARLGGVSAKELRLQNPFEPNVSQFWNVETVN